MLTKVAWFATARPKAVLAGTLLVMVVCGIFGASVSKHLQSGGFVAPGLDSFKASQYIDKNFPGGDPNLVVTVNSAGGVDSPAAGAAARRVIDTLQGRSDVVGVQSYWTSRPDLAQALVSSKDARNTGLVLATITGNDTSAQNTAGVLSKQLNSADANVTVRVGGLAGSFYDINQQSGKDLAIAEAVAVPISLLVLVLVFGSLVAASLPVAIGLFAIVVTLGILRLLTLLTDVSVFALNMTSALGLALAIDYSLFIVSRYREERERGLDTQAAIVRSVQTAGRTVLFSGLTVALSLSALLVFEPFFLKSFAYSGIAVIAMASGAALIVVPAMLMLLGDRVNAWDLRAPMLKLLRRTPAAPVDPERSRWYRVVVAVMKRAVPVTVLTTAALLLLGSPFLGAKFGYPDDRVLSSAAPSREVGDTLRADFAAQLGSSAVAVLPNYHGSVSDYAAALSNVADVPAVLSADGVYVAGKQRFPAPPGMANAAGTYLSVGTTLDPYSEKGAAQLAALRAVHAPGQVMFSGPAAMNEESLASISKRMPLALGLIALATLVVLFLFTGSVILPVKALLLNVLSLAATYGAMVWVFQDGHLSGLLGFTSVGYINAFMPMLMFLLAFGMSMDYEVFLLSRIREEWLASDRSTAANTHAVALGVARTGRIFTAAAVLMAIVFVAVASSKVSFMQLFGIGLALAVLSDATVIRMFLAPALMRLLGTANWWAPKPLAALHRRIGLEEDVPVRAAAPEPPTPVGSGT
ncbi:MAG: MMPL family transporter [Mycobacteriaceae bacterium]|nr:MMPL family transporter [Mycobacteriaceae bacterium]